MNENKDYVPLRKLSITSLDNIPGEINATRSSNSGSYARATLPTEENR